MKKTLTFIVIAIVAVAIYYYTKQKKQPTIINSGGSVVNDLEEEKNSNTSNENVYASIYGYNPSYTLDNFPRLTFGVGSYGYGYTFTKSGSMVAFNLSIEKMKEIDSKVQAFVEDVKNTGKAFDSNLITYFSTLSSEALRFAKEALTIKGYVITDADGNKYIIDSFDSVFADNLQKTRKGIESYLSIFKI